MDQTNFRLEDFIVENPIGQGAYGQIYKAVEQRSGKEFALKALNRRFLLKMKKQNLPIIEKNAIIRCHSIFVIHLFQILTVSNHHVRLFGRVDL